MKRELQSLTPSQRIEYLVASLRLDKYEKLARQKMAAEQRISRLRVRMAKLEEEISRDKLLDERRLPCGHFRVFALAEMCLKCKRTRRSK